MPFDAYSPSQMFQNAQTWGQTAKRQPNGEPNSSHDLPNLAALHGDVN